MTIPFADTGHVHISGLLWPADVTQTSGSSIPDLTCGASMGLAPRDLPAYVSNTEFSVVQRLDPAGGTADALLWRSGGDLVTLDDLVEEMGLCLATLNVPAALTTGSPDVPGFLFIGLVGGVFEYRHVPSDGILASPAADSGTLWDNELGVTNDDVRLVDVPLQPDGSVGPYLVITAPSTYVLGQDGLFVRSAGEALSSTAATEVLADLRPADHLVVDASRMHAVAHQDGAITVYYRVHDEDETFDGTAAIVISTAGVVVARPRVVIGAHVPVTSRAGALRHPVTNQILLAMEPAGSDHGRQIYWFATRGRGLSLDTVPLEWSATTHPHLFGGRWRAAAPDSTVTIVGMGWCDNKAGSGFRVFAAQVIGEISTVYRDFQNSFDTSADNNASARRALVGEIAVVRSSGEAGAEGNFSLLGASSAPMIAIETSRRGYDLEGDLLGARLVARLDELEGDQIIGIVGPEGTSFDVSPAPGWINGSQSFMQDDSQIAFTYSASLDTGTVAVSLWIYPMLSSALASRRVASKLPAWDVTWDEVAQTFEVTYTTVADGARTLTSIALSEDRWYHLTFVYDGVEASLYLFGVLVASDTPPTGGPLDTTASSVFLGFNDDDNTVDAARVRLDDLVVGLTATPVQAMHSFVLSGSNLTGPVVSAHSLSVPDRVTACLLATDPSPLEGEAGPVYSLSIRETDYGIMPSGELQRHVVLDLWRRERGTDPVYLGPLPTPPWLSDVVNAASPGFGYNPTLAHDSARWQGKMFVSGSFLTAFVPLVTGSQGDAHVVRYDLDVTDVTGSLSISRVATLDVSATGHVPCYGSEVLRSGGSYYAILGRGTPDMITQDVYVVREVDFGINPWATAAAASFASLLPTPARTHDGLTWNTDFGDGVTGDVFMDGVVGRFVAAGMGLAGAGNLQLVFGISSPGTGTNPGVNLVATACVFLDRGDIDAGTSPISVSISPVQIDEYGHGGIEPFSPIRWLPHPGGASGDTLMLVRTGLRAATEGVESGDGGLDVLRLKREGVWSIRPICAVPLVSTPAGVRRLGADACFSVDDEFDNEYVLVVGRPYPSASDRVSTLVMSSTEASDGGYAFPTPGALNSAIRTAEHATTLVLTDHVVQTRGFTDATTGPPLLDGSVNRVVPVIRWSTTGTPNPIGGGAYDSTSFNDQTHAALQGGCYSPPQRLVRFWASDGNDLVAAAGSKQPRLPVSGNYLRSGLVSLGTLRPPYGGTRVAPVGIVDLPADSVGRYVYLTYDAGTDLIPSSIRAYDSPYDDELNNAVSSVLLWTFSFEMEEHAYRAMRVVVVDDETYLYLVTPSGGLWFLRLPRPGAAAYDGGPTFITSLSARPRDRFYAVPMGNGRVVLYVADEDETGNRRTVAIVHEPGVESFTSDQPAGEIRRPEKTVITGSAPFPCSYAACVGRSRDGMDQVFVMLEPPTSRDGGARLSRLETDPLLGEFSGNAWSLASFTTDGYYLLDQVSISGVVPFMSGSHAAAQGGLDNVRTRPLLLSRVVDPVAETDVSTEYVLHVAAKELTRDGGEPDASKFRHDFAAAHELRADVGGNVLLANSDLDDESALYAHLIPGSLHVEHVGGIVHDGRYYSAVQGVANPLAGWELTDASGATGGAGNSNVTQDQVHGVKAHSVAPNGLVMAGWFVVGEPG